MLLQFPETYTQDAEYKNHYGKKTNNSDRKT